MFSTILLNSRWMMKSHRKNLQRQAENNELKIFTRENTMPKPCRKIRLVTAEKQERDGIVRFPHVQL